MLTIIKIIVLILWTSGLIWGLIYWGNTAWRNPAKLRETTLFDFFGIEKWFVFYLWVIRIVIPLIGLALLFIISMIILTFTGFIK